MTSYAHHRSHRRRFHRLTLIEQDLQWIFFPQVPEPPLPFHSKNTVINAINHVTLNWPFACWLTPNPVVPVHGFLVLMRKNVISLRRVWRVRVNVVRGVQYRWVSTSRNTEDVPVLIFDHNASMDVRIAWAFRVCELPWMPIVTMDTKDRRRRQRKNSHDNSCVRFRNSLHVVFNELAMVVLDLLSTGPVEIEFF